MLGEKWENIAGQEYEVVERAGVSNSGNIKWRIRFLETGYETVVEKVQMKRGKIKDKYEPVIFNRGYLGDVKMVQHKKAYNIWYSMLERCYDPNIYSFRSYGAKGVYVDARWYSFEQFLEDIPNIDGYDDVLFHENKLVLDKDVKQIGKANKAYSLETCTFLTPEENNLHRDNEHRKHDFIAISPSGEEFKTKGIKEFAREHHLIYQAIRQCLTGVAKTHKGWTFRYPAE